MHMAGVWRIGGMKILLMRGTCEDTREDVPYTWAWSLDTLNCTKICTFMEQILRDGSCQRHMKLFPQLCCWSGYIQI